jgi:hypothetical protein
MIPSQVKGMAASKNANFLQSSSMGQQENKATAFSAYVSVAASPALGASRG